MKNIEVAPNTSNFIYSLRDIGYTFEVAVADIIDNSITANARSIEMYFDKEPNILFGILDDGDGMTKFELIEAMRIATKNPLDQRAEKDLGRFGLGLKTASFSQCKKMTVFSKKNNLISGYQWDLDYVSKINKWELKYVDVLKYEGYQLVERLKNKKNGTLVIWEEIDRIEKNNIEEIGEKLRKHIALVFHRFLENNLNKIKITLNENIIKPFNPFNRTNNATQELDTETIYIDGSPIKVKPFILPHHSKISQQEYQQYETEEGYTKSQGFYLYRADRLLVHGTWFGLHKAVDAHKLVRISIDIPNNKDEDWGIDVKKSTAKPIPIIKKDLKRIISNITTKGSRIYTGRGKIIERIGKEKYWDIVPVGDDKISFKLNRENKFFIEILERMEDDQKEIFKLYIQFLEEDLPLDAILAKLQENPYLIEQKKEKTSAEKEKIKEKLLKLGINIELLELVFS